MPHRLMHAPRQDRHLAATRVLVLMGVSGSGKTTTGRRLSRFLGWTFRDGDELHPPENIEKMANGIPLDDEDRAPWLAAIAAWIDTRRASDTGAVIACSALKRAYRDVIIGNRSDVRLVYLKGSHALIADRMSRRRGHFMPPSLLKSQFRTLEEPQTDERPIVVSMRLPPKRVIERIVGQAGVQAPRLISPV